MKPIMIVIMFVMVVLLTSCTGIPVKTLYKLYQTDIMTLNPRIFRAAIRIPDYLEEGEKGMMLSLSSWKKGEQKETIDIKLDTVTNQTELAKLKIHHRKGSKLIVYKLTEKGISDFEHFRQQHKANRIRNGKQQKGSFSAGSDTCRKVELPNEPILVSNWLKVDNVSGYLPVLTDYDLKDKLKDRKLDEVLPMCVTRV